MMNLRLFLCLLSLFVLSAMHPDGFDSQLRCNLSRPSPGNARERKLQLFFQDFPPFHINQFRLPEALYAFSGRQGTEDKKREENNYNFFHFRFQH